MAGSKNNTGVAAFLPHRWRMLTAAGAATVGLACGVAKPALAEWWKLSKADRAASVTKPAPVENGFAGTIRKLTAESRRAAEQGDHAKAIQLAERAAKISEAAAQVVGPQGECSPQETARFLAQTRAQRSSVTVAAQPAATPVKQQVQQPQVQQPQRTVATVPQQQQVVAAQPQPQPARTPVAAAPRTRQAAPVVAKPQAPAIASSNGANAPGMFGASTSPASRGTSRPQPNRAANPLPPSPSQSSTTSDDLLAQSRLEAADGRLDRAIALADQAIAASPSTSLFGTAAKTGNSSEAIRWRNHLVTQRDASPVVAVAPVVQAPSETAPQQPGNWDEAAIEQPEPQVAVAGVNEVASVVTPESGAAASESLWSEELPPAPAPQPKHRHEALRFRRSEISRQGEWIDAAAVEGAATDNLRAASDVAPTEPSEAATEETPAIQETVDAVPEFPIVEAATPNVSDEPGAEQPAVADVVPEEPIVAAEEPAIEPVEAMPVEETPAARPPLRLRGGIQQVAAEFPAESSSSRKPTRDVAAKPEKSPFELPAEPQPEIKAQFQDGIPKQTTSDDFIDATADEPTAEIPVQRFPVQRVLQLRDRLKTATTFNPGASKTDAQVAPVAAPSIEPQPAAAKATNWEGDWQHAEPAVPAKRDASEAASSKRPSLKLRERLPALTSDTEEPAAKVSVTVPKAAPMVRSKDVGHSEMSHWKSADAPPAVKVQPIIAESGRSAVSQIGYEAPIIPPSATATAPETKQAEQANIAPPPPEWYDDGLVRKRAASSAVVRKRSFTLIDQLADALKIPASTAVSLIGVGGFVLFGVGLIAIRSALRKRHDA